MNVIIANQYKDALSNLNIDVIKRMDGEFDVSTIIDTFANFYFNRMILDITALRDYTNITTIQRLCTSLDASKIILFLNDDTRINNSFLSRVISLGIYNFTRDLSGVMYLMNNPNSYRDVAQYHDLAANEAKQMASPMQQPQNPQMDMGNFNNQNFGNNGTFNNQQFSSQDMSQNINGTDAYNSQLFNQNGYNNVPFNNGTMNNQQMMGNSPFQNFPSGGFNNNIGVNQPMQNFNGTAFNNGQNMVNTPFQSQPQYDYNDFGAHLIGFKDLTEDAGATTLIYMLKKQIKSMKVLAVELNSNDFSYFNDNELMSTASNNLDSLKSKFRQYDLVLMDLNSFGGDAEKACNEMIYLLEPSTIKLNSLLRRDRHILERIKEKKQKIVLNKSLLTVSDVKEFEFEAKTDIFYNIPPLDERKEHQMVLDSFLGKLKINSGNSEESNSGGIFSLFKK